MPLLPELTVPYKTYFKAAIVEGLRTVFANHPDLKLRYNDVHKTGTKVSIEFPTSELMYPSIVVKMHERDLQNIGVGHVEFLYVEDADVRSYKFRHMLYHCDLELSIYALSSLDRDLLSDAVVQTLMMPDMAAYTDAFFQRIYYPINLAADPDIDDRSPADARNIHRWNYVNISTDRIQPVGESQTPQPWLSEDQLVYASGYQTSAFGEFYSLPPAREVQGYGTIQHVNLYPYLPWEPVPTGVDDPSLWPES